MIKFTVYGDPQTAGSKRGFYIPKIKRVIITDANKKSRSWKEQVASASREVYRGELLRGPLCFHAAFFRPRPQGHYKSDGSLSKKGIENPVPTVRPDLLKLTRAVEDALKGVLYVDDSQIVRESLSKDWGEPARVEVTISNYQP